MVPRRLKNKLTKTIIFALVISAVVTGLMTFGFLDTWESRISDSFYAPGIPSP